MSPKLGKSFLLFCYIFANCLDFVLSNLSDYFSNCANFSKHFITIRICWTICLNQFHKQLCSIVCDVAKRRNSLLQIFAKQSSVACPKHFTGHKMLFMACKIRVNIICFHLADNLSIPCT